MREVSRLSGTTLKRLMGMTSKKKERFKLIVLREKPPVLTGFILGVCHLQDLIISVSFLFRGLTGFVNE